MSLDLFPLIDAAGPNRLLVEARLKPVQGHRFQPTGFPDLGAARFDAADGAHLLVESAQSMANRMEAVCWDETTNTPAAALTGISYVRVERDGKFLTSSMLEPHRLNSPYILPAKKSNKSGALLETLKGELEHDDKLPVDRHKLVETLFRYDAATLIHGVFLEKIAGRLRIERALSAFVEADGTQVAASGGVKLDSVSPNAGKAAEGFGNVPFQRDEYTAERITAYFNLDLDQLRSYRLGDDETALLVAMALYKIQAVLARGLRFRTACDLDTVEVLVTRPEGFTLPTLVDLEAALPGLVAACGGSFANAGGVTTVEFAA